MCSGQRLPQSLLHASESKAVLEAVFLCLQTGVTVHACAPLALHTLLLSPACMHAVLSVEHKQLCLSVPQTHSSFNSHAELLCLNQHPTHS